MQHVKRSVKLKPKFYEKAIMCLLVFYNKHFSLLMAFQMSKHVAQNYTHLVLLTIYVINYFNSAKKTLMLI
jgi:hypothetical protein